MGYVAFSLDVTGKIQTAASMVLCVSNDTSIQHGFSCWGLGGVTSSQGTYDAPRIGYTTDKVIMTINYTSSTCNSGYSTCTLIFVINKTQLYSLNGFNWTETQGLGYNYEITSTPSYEGTILFESPDFSTGSSGSMVTHYISQPEGSEQWTTKKWTVGDFNVGSMTSAQPGSGSIPLAADSSEFESSVYTGGVAWATANNYCPGSNQSCPSFVIFTVDSNGLPTGQVGQHGGFSYMNPNYWNMFYTAISTTINTTSVLGVSDYSCNDSAHNCTQYAGTEGFQLGDTGSGTFVASGRQSGSTTMLPLSQGELSYPWGDYNGCDYFSSNNATDSACIGQFSAGTAANPVTAREVFINQYS